MDDDRNVMVTDIFYGVIVWPDRDPRPAPVLRVLRTVGVDAYRGICNFMFNVSPSPGHLADLMEQVDLFDWFATACDTSQ